MPRPRCIDPKLVSKAQAVVAKTADLGEFRAAQAILLPALAHTTLEQTAALLGVGRATVARLQQRLRETAPAAAPMRRGWGGRRRALLTFQEEVEFLAPFVEQAKAAGVLVVSPLRAALAEKLGRKVAASVVYRLLARHGWRKLSPDTKHPKSDPLAQAEWKKNSPRCWQICSPPKRSAGGRSA
jgi:transposase